MDDLLNEDIVDTPDDIEGGGGGERVNISGQESGSDDGKKENENKENENDQDKDKVKIKRKMGPRPIVNADRLKGPRGLAVMESFFSDVRLRGKGHEREDLDLVMGRLEHWTHRLCPKMQFDDSLKRIEKLGSRKDVSNLVKRIRLGMVDDEGVDAPVIDAPDSPQPRAPSPDPFDQLLSSHTVAAAPVSSEITDDQRERMLRNRLIAEEKRAARIQKAKEMQEQFKNNALTQSQVAADGAKRQEETQREVENVDREPMDVDEDVTDHANGGNVEFSGNEHNLGENRNSIHEIGNQPDLVGNGNDGAPLENDMDVDEMQPDILASGNHVQPDLLRAANRNSNDEQVNGMSLGARGNQPDVLGAGNAGDDNMMESNQNQPDILAGSNNPPDILAGRSENPPDLVERNSNPPDLLN